jgi:hypothetical protein
MTNYHLNFHHFPIPAEVKPTASELEAMNLQWQKFIGEIARQGKFVGTQRLDQVGYIVSPDGKVANAITDGKGLIVGTLTLSADTPEEAIELAKGCPILNMGGSVEVRPVIPFEVKN